ncbi:alpha/beta fold hydrolase [Radicibacter daui]|uniref:alpha/beta fold hydrolase n=1 Tax=Radicibacter daui TaxID=3064829 RepID=UPI004046E82D
MTGKRTPAPTPISQEKPPAARLGPRPLWLHLGLAAMPWLGSPAAWTQWKQGSPPWKGAQASDLEAVARKLADYPAEAVEAALAAEGVRRLARMMAGVSRYRAHPWHRPPEAAPVLWQEGSTRLLDYGAEGGRPLLIVPSLINRAYVLDLMAERSFLRFLAGAGLRPLLVDWGVPGAAETNFGLDDYVAGRLARALAVTRTLAGGPVPVIGYCMGGLLAAGLAALEPAAISALVFLATPWDFYVADDGVTGRQMAALHAVLAPALSAWGAMPTDMLQLFFTALDPLLAARKFSRFAAAEAGEPPPEGRPDSAFVAVEDWLNDGVPLVARVAGECLAGWWGANTPATGKWEVAGCPVVAGKLAQPSLVVVPSADRIVPPASALALASALPRRDLIEPPLGHIGMMVSAKAPGWVWQPLRDWLVTMTAS